jgi:ferredoxin
MIEIRVDGRPVRVEEGTTLLEACDAAGIYIPRLCAYPGLSCCADSGRGGPVCGLCVVRVAARGEGAASGPATAMVPACRTGISPGMDVATSDAGLLQRRLHHLAEIMAGHPRVCLTCPDREGCARDSCSFGHPVEARCCDEFGHCEIGRLHAYLDPEGPLAGAAVAVPREATVEGRIRREPGLCVACGRCVVVCWETEEGGNALGIGPDGRPEPPAGTLRDSGCTFCGQCVIVCPTGAITAPGEAGAAWLAKRRERSGLAAPVLPPQPWLRVDSGAPAAVHSAPGVFQLLDERGKVLYIAGVADLRRGLGRALEESMASFATYFMVEEDPLYTQRESEFLTRYAQEQGHLPPGNDMADDLFGDDADDLDEDL